MNRTIALLSLLLVWVTGSFAQQRTDSVHVAHYDLHLSVVDFTGHTVSGYTDLTLVAKVNNLTQVRLDLKALTTDSVSINGAAATFSHIGEKLLVTMPAIQSGDTAIMRVHYHGTPAHDSYFGGFYFNGQYAYNYGVALEATPHAYGRVWFPCLDEFTDKSSYSFHIRTENGKRGICNGLLTDSLLLEDNTTLWSWQLDEEIPTYLASIAVGDFSCYADTFHGIEKVIPIEIYTAPSLHDNVAASFVHLKDVLRKYEENFGPYRWPKVGYVCVAASGGAMEHATNIALPNAAVNGSLVYEGTIMHELFHHWFGDLITCERPEEMWINEGFADYSESMIREWLYNTDTFNAYAENIKSEHNSTLMNLAKQDGGLYALDNVPQDHTYGMHSYQKGGQIVHTLRNYMGDSLFFNCLKQLLTQYAYQNINSEEFFTYLTQVSGMNLMHFYEDWIHQPGFLDFDVEKVEGHDNGNFSVFVRQNGYGTSHLGTNVPVDITFVSDNMEFYTVENQLISGEMTEVALHSPFTPALVILDYYGKLADATIDDTKKVAAPGSVSFTETFCTAQINQIADSAMIRVEHHYVAPVAPSPLPEGYYNFSQTHYWRVNWVGSAPDGVWKFKLNRSVGQLDAELFADSYTFDNLKLMYRPNSQSAWIPVPYIRNGSPYSSTITTSDMKAGEYCFAMAEEGVSVNEIDNVKLSIHPNPATQTFTLTTDATKADKAILFDSLGRKVKTWRISDNSQVINVNSLPAGNYILVLYHKGKSVARTMFVKR
ncbi:MAG: T9SS type A sorting domain-containing protein [Bacteroidales bacterium]|nr:T9SS type A sorting domain-containing protein [Bacteroidales bacterium]